MAESLKNHKDWHYYAAPSRLDSFNFDKVKSDLERLTKSHLQVAVDVNGAQFVSIPVIKLIHAIGAELVRRGGRLALIGASEKLKRQIHIFASVEVMDFYSRDAWSKMSLGVGSGKKSSEPEATI